MACIWTLGFEVDHGLPCDKGLTCEGCPYHKKGASPNETSEE